MPLLNQNFSQEPLGPQAKCNSLPQSYAHNSCNPSVLWCHQPQSHRMVNVHPVLLLCISECPTFFFSHFSCFPPTAQVSLTHHQSLFCTSASPFHPLHPWGHSFLLPPSRYLPEFPKLRLSLAPRPASAWFRQDPVILWTLSPSSERKGIAPPLPPRPANVTFSRKPSLFPDPSDTPGHLVVHHTAPCCPSKHLSNHDQVGMCGNAGMVPVSLA